MQTLPELFGDEGHEGVQEPETVVQTRVQCLLRGLARRLRCGLVRHGLHRFLLEIKIIRRLYAGELACTYDVDVTELVQPEIV